MIQSLFTHSHVIPNLCDVLFPKKHERRCVLVFVHTVGVNVVWFPKLFKSSIEERNSFKYGIVLHYIFFLGGGGGMGSDKNVSVI